MRRWGKVIGVSALGALLLSACSFGVTGSTDEVSDVSAQLSGQAGNTKADTTQWWFEYGRTPRYGSSTTHGSIVVGDTSSLYAVQKDVSGLAEGATYHYRLCTRGSDGAGTCGNDATFTTTSGHD